MSLHSIPQQHNHLTDLISATRPVRAVPRTRGAHRCPRRARSFSTWARKRVASSVACLREVTDGLTLLTLGLAAILGAGIAAAMGVFL